MSRLVGPLAATVLTAVAVAVGALAAPGVAATPAPPSPSPVVERALPFAHAGGRTLRMDVHHPRGPRPPAGAPAVVLVHGGGFHSGDRSRMSPYARAFAARGYLAASIDYRLRPHAEIRARGYAAGEPRAQQDAEAAVRYVRRHRAGLGVDADRLVIMGASAGAITALNVGARAAGTARVAAAVGIGGYGPAADLGPGDPPLLLLHGDADRAIPLSRARATCRAARTAGVRCDLVTFPGAGHRLITEQPGALVALAAAWLERLGRSASGH
jgi:acetyl esterase/lipase